jgi:hypothetical protein
MNKSNIEPLTRETFNAFLKSNHFSLNATDKSTNQPVSDAVVLYNIVIQKLQDQGVQFSSPGNSPQRHFILWFNAQIDKSYTYSYQIDIKEKYYELICEMIREISPSNLNK